MVRRLEKLCDSAYSDFFKGKFETLSEYQQERNKVVEKIAFDPGVSIITNDKAMNFYKKIYPEDKSKCGKLIHAIYAKKEFGIGPHGFQRGEIEQLAIDEFYSWICGEDYIENLLEISKLTLTIDVPPKLHHYIEEARCCYALQNYLAACALSRTVLEAFSLHLCDLLEKKI